MSLENVSYVFLPFRYGKHADFNAVIDDLNESSTWMLVHDEIMYMLKYVADKINSEDRKNCQCFHYQLREESRKEMGLASSSEWYTTTEHEYHGSMERFRFQILDIHLYCFSTSVCIMAFKLYFEKNDPMWISSAQYYIKKVSREKIGIGEKNSFVTMLEMAKRITAPLEKITTMEFFYYANPSTERANLLTYLEVPSKDDYKYELFYLRRCYSEGFLYIENGQIDKEEIYLPSEDTIWGISPEAAVCLVCPERGREEFLKKTFFQNFNQQYLFMYILLLHQKYVLYMFLTKIGVGTYNDLEQLEEYRNQLYEFETDFVFSCVTEVPQYQNLYDRMVQAFSLKKMYEDVHEPLVSLGEVRRVTYEKESKKRETSVNNALMMLSVLSFFSALMDSFDFIESFFGWFLSPEGIKIAQSSCVVVIVLILFFVLKNLLKSKNDA